jgi:hypothetical protein
VSLTITSTWPLEFGKVIALFEPAAVPVSSMLYGPAAPAKKIFENGSAEVPSDDPPTVAAWISVVIGGEVSPPDPVNV